MIKYCNILLVGLGAPPRYETRDWFLGEESLGTAAAAFALLTRKHDIDRLIIVGTERALNKTLPHYQQVEKDLGAVGFDREKVTEIKITDLSSPEAFWESFQDIVRHGFFDEPVNLYVDITFGYRTQPQLVFFSAYFLSELRPGAVCIRKIYYGMHDHPSHPTIVDFTALYDLLQWIKAAQSFTEAGSGKTLSKKIEGSVSGGKHRALFETFKKFAEAYSFNHVADLPAKAMSFRSEYNRAETRELLSGELMPLHLLHEYLITFIRDCTTGDDLDIQFRLARRNFDDGHYARSVITLRECMVTLFSMPLEATGNRLRSKVSSLMLNIPAKFRGKMGGTPLSAADARIASYIVDLLSEIYPVTMLDNFYLAWDKVRILRNASGHSTGQGQTTSEDLIADLKHHLDEFEQAMPVFRHGYPALEVKKNKLLRLLKGKGIPDPGPVYLIVNDGMHPILPQLAEQFGTDIICETVSSGNISIDQEEELAAVAKGLAEKYRNHRIHIVPSGYPYMAVVIYNVVQQTTARHPIWLQFDKDRNRYLEKNLDPRALLPG